MARVFLSYARADRVRVNELAAALERAGHEVWWDRRLSGGAEFEHQIEQALAGADVVVVAWSVASVRSHWVRDEAAAGRDSNRLGPCRSAPFWSGLFAMQSGAGRGIAVTGRYLGRAA